jgi:hypothetical protein
VSARGFGALAFVFVCFAVLSSAHAAPRLSGAVDGRMLIGVTGRYGGALGLDLWAGSSVVRVGGTFGVGALSKSDDASSRVFTPFGLSLGFMPRDDDRSGPSAVLRGGGYAGAQKGGLLLGPFASVALGYRFALGEGASVRVGVDAWTLFLNHGGLFLGPYFGLGF